MKALPLDWGHKRKFLEIPPRTPVALGDRICLGFERLPHGLRVGLMLIGIVVSLYFTLGFARWILIEGFGNPHILIPSIDWWWIKMFGYRS